jgi:hypothetical protein
MNPAAGGWIMMLAVYLHVGDLTLAPAACIY